MKDIPEMIFIEKLLKIRIINTKKKEMKDLLMEAYSIMIWSSIDLLMLTIIEHSSHQLPYTVIGPSI
jgi:hypothetical protein